MEGKTAVKIIADVCQSKIKKGSIGYIDGYVVGGDGRPCAVVIYYNLIELLPIHALEAIIENDL